jgi:hypothetical protein
MNRYRARPTRVKAKSIQRQDADTFSVVAILILLTLLIG